MDTGKDTMVKELEQPIGIHDGKEPHSNGNLTPEDSATRAQRLFDDMRDVSIATGKTVKLREIDGKPVIGLVPRDNNSAPSTKPEEDEAGIVYPIDDAERIRELRSLANELGTDVTQTLPNGLTRSIPPSVDSLMRRKGPIIIKPITNAQPVETTQPSDLEVSTGE